MKKAKMPAPSQLKVGYKYQHLFVPGLRQRNNLRARGRLGPNYPPELSTVTVIAIQDTTFGPAKVRLILYKQDGNERINVASYYYDNESELDTYNDRFYDMFFHLEPANRRSTLMSTRLGGRRKTKRRSK